MKNVLQLAVGIAVLAIAVPALATQGVSPGATDRIAVVSDPCPTFSWLLDEGALGYELVAYGLPEDPAAPVELTADTEVLFAAVPAGATSWTPSTDQCVAPGGRYVWFVRAATELAGDQIVEAGEWSQGRYFQVPAGPSDEEVARALEVLKRWEAAGGSEPLFAATATAADAVAVSAMETGAGSSAGKRSGGASPTLRRLGSEGVFSDSGSSHRKSVPTASAAIRGEHPDTTGEVYGIVGTSASADGAGVAAANLDGGPDLVLDGSADGQVDTLLSQAGIDRPSAVDETFVMDNTGAGRLHVEVKGDLSSDVLSVEEVVVNGMTVIDVGHDWLGNGSTVPCASCVTSSDIADGGVDSADLAGGAVTGAKISAEAVGSGALRNGSVTTVKIADNAVTADKVAAQAIGGDAITDGSITAADLADDAVTGDKILGNSISSGHIVNQTITTADLADEAVSEVKIEDQAVTGSKIIGNSITSSHIVNQTIAAADLADGAVSEAKILNGAVTGAKIPGGSITGGHIVDQTIDTYDLADGAVSAVKIEDGAVTGTKIAGNAVTTATIADGTITEADVSTLSAIYVSKTQLYEREIPQFFPSSMVGGFIFDVSCFDANDLPVFGSCYADSTQLDLRGEEAVDWASTDDPAAIRCHIYKSDSGFSGTGYAKILCLDVP